jgi:hypothetical protein
MPNQLDQIASAAPEDGRTSSRRRLVAGYLPATGHRRRHGLPRTPEPFQKPVGIVRCKRLILQRRNRPVSLLQKQVIIEGNGLGRGFALSNLSKGL